MTGFQLTPYETRQLAAIHEWQAQSPGWGARLMAKPGGRIAQAVQSMVPVDALRAALTGVNRVAERLSDEQSILKRAKAGSLEELLSLIHISEPTRPY